MPEERAGPALSLAEQKRRLRAEILARRDGIPADQRAALNQRITAKLLSLPEYQVAGVVAAYMSIGSEVDTGALIRDVLGRGKMLVLPRVDRERKRLVLYGVADPERDLLAGTWGIKEPDPARCREVSWQQVEWALVPGLAFDCAGNRLGYGGGYYDRLIASQARRPFLAAAAYAIQLVEQVPAAPGDRPVDLVVTENEWCWAQAGYGG